MTSLSAGCQRKGEMMKLLPQYVKDSADKKWSKRAKTRKEAFEWFRDKGRGLCSFCYYYWKGRPLHKNCGCPLMSSDPLIFCCKEFKELNEMHDKAARSVIADPLRYINLKRFNELCEAVQTRIRNLKVG